MSIKKLTWITLFSIAMGFMEASVVVYLRKIYYPEGFVFPFVSIDHDILITEICREASTILMLLSIGILTGKNSVQKFAIFIYCFAIWDIFYYVFLKLLLNWPESLLTNDILFLIPFPWIAPVLTPCIVSFTMIALSLSILYYHKKNNMVTITKKEWVIFSFGSLIIILSFMWDYIQVRLHAMPNGNIINNSLNDLTIHGNNEYIPVDFNWPLFISGELVLIYGIIILVRRWKEG